jgi:hypothetical protein
VTAKNNPLNKQDILQMDNQDGKNLFYPDHIS